MSNGLCLSQPFELSPILLKPHVFVHPKNVYTKERVDHVGVSEQRSEEKDIIIHAVQTAQDLVHALLHRLCPTDEHEIPRLAGPA